MEVYRYHNIPLSPAVIIELITEVVSILPRPCKRIDLINKVEELHKSRGGRADGNTTAAFKKALARLVDEGRAERKANGYYAFNSSPESQVTGDPAPAALMEEPVPVLNVDQEAGHGPETVYVYFTESDEKLARIENRDWWACKVGHTVGSPTARILGQGVTTSMPKLPKVGLLLRCSDGKGLERVLHFALDEADARIDEGAGQEWFYTSPEKILTWFKVFQQANVSLKR